MRAGRVLAGAALAAALLALPSVAYAAPERRVIQGEVLQIVSTLDHVAAGSLAPGERIGWALEISADAPDPGRIDVSLERHGALEVQVGVSHCDVPWPDGVCAAGERLLHSARPAPLDGSRVHLVTTAADAAAYLHLVVEAPELPAGAAATDIHVIAEGFGEAVEARAGPSDPAPGPLDQPPAGGGGGLAVTGVDAAWPGALGLAAILGGTGAALLARRGRHAGAGS